MAVVEMSKLNLAAMSYEKDAVLNALQRTGAAEVKLHCDAENTAAVAADTEELRAYLNNAEGALEVLCAAADGYYKQNKIKGDGKKDVEVSYTEFITAGQRREKADALISKIYELDGRDRELNSELLKLRRTISAAEIYRDVKEPLQCADTPHARFRLGTVPASSKDSLISELDRLALCAYYPLASNQESALIMVAAHRAEAEAADEALQTANFVKCQFIGGQTGEELYSSLKEQEEQLKNLIAENGGQWVELFKQIRELKIYCDYVGFELEKAELAEKLRRTQTTFLLEAYVPTQAEELIKGELSGVSDAIYIEFSKPSEDEIPPTLLSNNKVIKNFEAVTNMYSPVNYREFDPNTIMAVFYSVFLGFIMADIGYGLLMFVLGGFLYLRCARDTGMKRLAGVFAIGGIFAIIWGILFASMFGIRLDFMPFSLPDAQHDMWSVMGIKIPAVLVISLLLGMVQLCAGYLCKAYRCIRRGEIVDAIFDGFVWAVFTVGVALAAVGLVEQFNAPFLTLPGGIIAGATLVIAMLTAGRKEKLIGKFTKGFGAAYGVINFASDILSYARLYGLMLSGAVIAQIVSQYSVDFITGGNAGLVILGIVLMLVGHAFNLAIGLLGAYIHDARLQYVEFYGRFYDGEGELFTPLGSQHKYVLLNK